MKLWIHRRHCLATGTNLRSRGRLQLPDHKTGTNCPHNKLTLYANTKTKQSHNLHATSAKKICRSFFFFLLRLIWQHYCYRSSNQPPLWLFWNYFRGNNILKSCGTVGIWLMSVIFFWLLIKTAPMNWFIIIHPAYSILNTDDYLYLVLTELLLTHYLKVCLFVFCKIWD